MITIAATPEEALQASGEFRAGGTDLQTRRRAGISDGPLVDIRNLQGYDVISWRQDGGASLGALVTLHELAADPGFSRGYPGISQSAAGLATPQIRYMATLGGSLLQHTRCWYYRHPDFRCYKKGEPLCPARDGHNPNGVIFDLSPCVYPHPSTMGMALLAYDAQFETFGDNPRPIADLYGDGSDPARDHTLQPDQLLTQIHLPSPASGERTAYFRAISRAEAEWPTVEAMARLKIEDDRITMARLAVGGVAHIPMRLPQVEEALIGQPARPETVHNAAPLAAQGANPLPETRYKVDILIGTVLEVIERTLN